MAMASSAGPVCPGLERLESLLRQWRWAPWTSARDWDAYQLARYTGGRLAQEGFEVVLAHAGADWWVVVYIEGGCAPVVPGYPNDEKKPADKGSRLGYLPLRLPSECTFDPRYLSWEDMVPLPPNRPPVAKIRVLQREIELGEKAQFLGGGSYDPDGMLVRYLWDFGDGAWGYEMTERHSYRQPGHYTVTLYVIDDGGLLAQDQLEVNVHPPDEAGPEDQNGGCGCGG